MTVRYDVVAITGKYTNREGKEKNRYQKLGVVNELPSGSLMLIIESIPVGWTGTAFLNDPKEKESVPVTGGVADLKSDLPF